MIGITTRPIQASPNKTTMIKKDNTETSDKTEAMTDESSIISGLMFAQTEVFCYCCNNRVHSKPKSEWADKKMKEVVHAQQNPKSGCS